MDRLIARCVCACQMATSYLVFEHAKKSGVVPTAGTCDPETGLTPASAAPGLGSPRPTFALGLGPPGPRLHRDWAHPTLHRRLY